MRTKKVVVAAAGLLLLVKFPRRPPRPECRLLASRSARHVALADPPASSRILPHPRGTATSCPTSLTSLSPAVYPRSPFILSFFLTRRSPRSRPPRPRNSRMTRGSRPTWTLSSRRTRRSAARSRRP
jgi:hypothetical protein